jgi:hypothetical protein
MTNATTKSEVLQGTSTASTASSQLFDDWFDPIESAVRNRGRALIEEMIRSERRAHHEHRDRAGTHKRTRGSLPHRSH